MIILVLILFYPVIVGIALLILNDKALLPGTTNYKRRQLVRQDELNIERARTRAIEARYQLRENENIHQTLALEAAPHGT